MSEASETEIVARSPELAQAPFAAAVCVPTFRRPELLARTLASLAQQRASDGGHIRFAVVVVDNDGAGRAGAALAAGLLASGGFEGAVLVEPRQGNCNTYNAAWRFVRAKLPHVPYICGIDDDEEARPGWLAALIEGAEHSGSAIVGGRVVPVFSEARFDHLGRHPVFRSHYTADGPVPVLYSSANYLIGSHVLDALGYPYLDEAFDYKGGGDADFFNRARLAGFPFHWANNAVMTESVPARRTEFSWIHARSVRNGMLSAMIEHKANPAPVGRIRTVLKSLGLLAASPLRGLADLVRTGSPVIALYHLQVAIGRLGAELGLNIEQYRQPEKN